MRATRVQAEVTNRAEIDQAIAIVHSCCGGSTRTAFDELHQISQAENIREGR